MILIIYILVIFCGFSSFLTSSGYCTERKDSEIIELAAEDFPLLPPGVQFKGEAHSNQTKECQYSLEVGQPKEDYFLLRLLKEKGLRGLYNWQKHVVGKINKAIEDSPIESKEYSGKIRKSRIDEKQNLFMNNERYRRDILKQIKYSSELYVLYESGNLHFDYLNELDKRILFSLFSDSRSTLATQACMMMEMPLYTSNNPERIAIIGGGYTGVMTALVLSLLRSQSGDKLYEVHLFEANKNLMDGASIMPGRLHLGGEYPKDFETAKDCLLSAIIFRQMFQDSAAYTTVPGVAYLLSQQTEDLTLQKMVEHYKKIRNMYKHFYRKVLRNAYGTETDRLFFGNPKEIAFKIMEGHQFLKKTKGFKGGIYAHEKGLHPIYLGTILEHLLKREGVEVHLETKALNPLHIGLHKAGKDAIIKGSERFWSRDYGGVFDHLINATWTEFRLLEHTCAPVHGMDRRVEEVRVHHRAMLLADISQCQIPIARFDEKTAFFGQLGEGGGMVSPINHKYALCFWPSIEGSYIGTSVRDNLSFSFTLRKMIGNPFKGVDEQLRIDNILKTFSKRYPVYKDARFVKLIIRDTIADQKELEKRRFIKPACPFKDAKGNMALTIFTRDYTRALSPKATYAPVVALQAAFTVLEASRERGYKKAAEFDIRSYEWLKKLYTAGVTHETVVLPDVFRFKAGLPLNELRQRAQSYCKIRELPKEMCE